MRSRVPLHSCFSLWARQHGRLHVLVKHAGHRYSESLLLHISHGMADCSFLASIIQISVGGIIVCSL